MCHSDKIYNYSNAILPFQNWYQCLLVLLLSLVALDKVTDYLCLYLLDKCAERDQIFK